MKVSIITPAYNSTAHLKSAIESVLNQHFDDYEMIIVNDGSIDNTEAVALEYAKNFPQKIKYIAQENGGPAKARNTALKAAQGIYIALLDADDQWLPNHLNESIQTIEADPTCALVHANIMKIDATGKELGIPARDQQYLSGKIFKHLVLRKAHIACPTVLFKKECLAKVGFFDESNNCIGCEDRDLWLRIAVHFNIRYIDRVLTNYRISAGSVSKNREKMMRARAYIIEKNIPKGEIGLKRKAYAVIHKDLADEFLYEGDFPLASSHYARSLAYWPFSPFSIINYVKSLLKVRPT